MGWRVEPEVLLSAAGQVVGREEADRQLLSEHLQLFRSERGQKVADGLRRFLGFFCPR